MDPRLRDHTPGPEALRRAADDGVDLERLKIDDPVAYMVRNAGTVVTAAPELAHLAEGMLTAAFPDRQVFRAEVAEGVRVLAFPPLDGEELRSYDRWLAPLVDRPEWRARHAYYREVGDLRGVGRELGLPQGPDAYRGGEGVIGPFEDGADADAWAEEHVTRPLVHDSFPMNGRWFCDVFRAEAP